MESTKKHIIVTGGAGFIGSHTVVQLFSAGFIPVIVDDFRNSESFIIERLEKITGQSIIVHNCDCSNEGMLSEIFNIYKPYGVIHFAAYKAVGESVKEPLKYYQNNIGSLLNVLNVCKKLGVFNVVFSSSCTVYGEPDKIPVTEDTPTKEATSPYGFTKQVCERICSDFVIAEPNFKIILLRYFNPIGAHPSALIGELPIGVPNNLVPFITQTVQGLRDQLTVFGNTYPTKDGTCIRDYIHVVDLAEAHVCALKKIETITSSCEVYNVGTGIGSTVLEVVHAFEKRNTIKVNYVIGPKREGDAVQIYAENSKIIRELDWTPKFSLEDAVEHAWKWQITLK
jgi:UDP-glucose 4-epimerase